MYTTVKKFQASLKGNVLSFSFSFFEVIMSFYQYLHDTIRETCGTGMARV